MESDTQNKVVEQYPSGIRRCAACESRSPHGTSVLNDVMLLKVQVAVIKAICVNLVRSYHQDASRYSIRGNHKNPTDFTLGWNDMDDEDLKQPAH